MTALAALAAVAAVSAATAAVTERVSLSSNEQQGNDISGRLSRPALSTDGLFVVFDSRANNLVPGDSGTIVDLFVRDRQAGTLERVSVNSNGQAGNEDSAYAKISGDGRYVVFHSFSRNLAPDDDAFFDVFLRDRQTDQTSLISLSSNGTPGNGHSLYPELTPDGRYVAFISEAMNLDPGKTHSHRDVFVRDRQLGTTERVSLTDDDLEANNSATTTDLSGDGNLVAFPSFASNMVPNDTNDAADIFVRDRTAGVTERVSVSSSEVQADAGSFDAMISHNGRYVAFYSEATNLVPMDLNGVRDIFVRDRLAGTTERVSVSSSEQEANRQSNGPGIRGGLAFGPDISADGRYVTFDSIATNLVPGDTNTCEPNYQSPPGICPDVFVRDRVAGTTARASVSSAGAQADRASTDPAISADGLTIAFFSSATNLVPGDTNTCFPSFLDPGECPDIFVRVESGGGGGADLGVTQTDSPDPVVVGARVTYSVVVTNGGPAAGAGAKLVDTLPKRTKFISATSSTGSCSRVRRKLTCTFGTLPAGGEATVSVVVKTKATGTISNRAVVSSTEPDPDGSDNTDTETTTVVPA